MGFEAVFSLPQATVSVVLGSADYPTIGPLIQNATRPAWVVIIYNQDNSKLNITGATFTGVLRDMDSNQSIASTVGSYAITEATGGKFTYSPVAADVAVPGRWLWETTLTISSQTYKVRAWVMMLPSIA